MDWDLIIIGAGPAGMAAAVQANKLGCTVLVLDRQQEPGGQIYRSVNSATPEARKSLGKDYCHGKALVDQFFASNVTFMPSTTVWHVDKGKVYVSQGGESKALSARHILMATGAMERPVPVEGWTLPGVLGAGASDVLLKSAGLMPKGPVIVCGNGPLILQSVEHLRHFNIPIAGIVMTGDLKLSMRAAPAFPQALLRPCYLVKGGLMGLGVVRGGKTFYGAHSLSIESTGSNASDMLRLSFSSLGNKKHTLEAATILLHEGIISETRITHLAGLAHDWDPEQRSWYARADVWGSTSSEGMSVAGDCAGVKGALASITRGSLAALEIARKLGKISQEERDKQSCKKRFDLFRYARMQSFLDRVFVPNPKNLCMSDETIVCRCEGLSAGALRKAILDGSHSLAGLKSQARCGMGTCQGRMCSSAVAELISQCHGIPLDQLEQYQAQFPLTPISLGELASMTMPPNEF